MRNRGVKLHTTINIKKGKNYLDFEADLPQKKTGLASIFRLSWNTFFLGLAIILFLGPTPQLKAYNEKQYARAIRFKICIKCDLYKANFSGIDLSYADFSGSNLILATFQKATLYRANFDKANLSGANFEGAMWINGAICQENSYGKCNIKKNK